MAGRQRHSGAMHVVTNTIRRGDRVYTARLLRRSYREGGKVKKETLANLSHLPEEVIELIRGALRGQRYLAAGEAFEVERSLPAGPVEGALLMARPVAVEVFEGSLHDDKTLPAQLDKLRKRFGLTSVIVVSDRGMVTKANLELLRADGDAAWITALKAPQVKKLVKDGALQLSLFDDH